MQSTMVVIMSVNLDFETFIKGHGERILIYVIGVVYFKKRSTPQRRQCIYCCAD